MNLFANEFVAYASLEFAAGHGFRTWGANMMAADTAPTVLALDGQAEIRRPDRIVAHVVQRLAVGGAETFAFDFLRSMPETTRLYSLEATVSELVAGWPLLAPMAGKLRAFGGGGGISPRLPFQLARAFRADGVDAVVLHHIGPLLYGGVGARLARIGCVVHVEHDAWHYRQNARHAAITRLCETWVRPVHVAVSREVAEGGAAAVRGLSYDVIPPGIDCRQFSPSSQRAARERVGLPADVVILGTVGRLVELKRQDLMLEAAAQLGATVHVVLVGDGPERAALEATAHRVGLAGRVHFLGQRSDLPAVLPAFDVFCLPSRVEGLPRSLLEAQAIGLRVVASDVGDVRRALYGPTGRLVPPGDRDALVAALREVLAVPADPAGAHAYVAERFSWTATLDRFNHLTSAPC